MEKAACEVESFKLFAFGLGELVCLQQEVENASRDNSSSGWPMTPTPMLKVISRELVEDCTGSVCRIYWSRSFDREGGVGILRFQELELCRPPVIPTKAKEPTK